jgi:predicted Ser/Thr protein kinase
LDAKKFTGIRRFSGLVEVGPSERMAVMEEGKDTRRAWVRIGYDGRVSKIFRGHQARERFENEVKVLRYLEKKECPFVPRIVETDPSRLFLLTTNCGKRVEHLGEEKKKSLFAELESYGVRHDDAEMRNVTYRASDGRFCLIDFEFATILDDPNHRSPVPMPPVP